MRWQAELCWAPRRLTIGWGNGKEIATCAGGNGTGRKVSETTVCGEEDNSKNKVVGLASEISRQNVGNANLLSLLRAGGMRYIKKEVLVFNQN